METNFTGMSAKEMAAATRVKHDQWMNAIAQSDSRFLAENRPCFHTHELAEAVLSWAKDNTDKYQGLPVYEEMIKKAASVDALYDQIVEFREKALFLDAVILIKQELPKVANQAMEAVEAMAAAH